MDKFLVACGRVDDDYWWYVKVWIDDDRTGFVGAESGMLYHSPQMYSRKSYAMAALEKFRAGVDN